MDLRAANDVGLVGLAGLDGANESFVIGRRGRNGFSFPFRFVPGVAEAQIDFVVTPVEIEHQCAVSAVGFEAERVAVTRAPARGVNETDRAVGEFEFDDGGVVGIEFFAVPFGDEVTGRIAFRERPQSAPDARDFTGHAGGQIENVTAEVAEHAAGAGRGLQAPEHGIFFPAAPNG